MGFVGGSNRDLGFMHANPFSPSHRPFEWLCAGHIFGSWRSRWNWVLASDGWLGRTPGAAPFDQTLRVDTCQLWTNGDVIWGVFFWDELVCFDVFGEWLVSQSVFWRLQQWGEVWFRLLDNWCLHWCKIFSFTVILSMGLPRTVPKGFAWKHHHYCMINSFCSWLHVSIVVECCIFSLFFIVVTVLSYFCRSAYHSIDNFFIFFDSSTIALEHTTGTKDPFIQGFGYASRVSSWQDMLKLSWTYYLVKAQVSIIIFTSVKDIWLYQLYPIYIADWSLYVEIVESFPIHFLAGSCQQDVWTIGNKHWGIHGINLETARASGEKKRRVWKFLVR